MLLSFRPIWFRRAFHRSGQEVKATWGFCIFLFKSIWECTIDLFVATCPASNYLDAFFIELGILICWSSLFFYISFSDGVLFPHNGVSRTCGFSSVSSHLKYSIFVVHVYSFEGMSVPVRHIEFTKHDGKILSVKEANAKTNFYILKSTHISKKRYRVCLYW